MVTAARVLRAEVALIGEGLVPSTRVCVFINDEGVIESIEGHAACPINSLRVDLLTPPPANAHVHSADYAFPEFGYDKPLEKLVQPPRGIKHQLLSILAEGDAVKAIKSFYSLAQSMGVGLLVDFREEKAGGCRAAAEAREGLWFTEVVILGRPRFRGKDLEPECDGVGLSSPLDYALADIKSLAEKYSIVAAHVAETREAREKGDLERALVAGVNLLVHGTYLSRSDLDHAAARGARIVLCPRSNAWHGVGLPKFRDVVESGIIYGFGTDNAAWHGPDVVEEARILLYASRLDGWKAGELADALIFGLFAGGYMAVGRDPPFILEGERAWMAGYRMPDTIHARLAAREDSARLLFWILKRVKMGYAEVLVKGPRVAVQSHDLNLLT